MTLFFRVSLLGFILFNMFITGCNHLFYYPDSTVRLTPSQLNLKYEDISIETKDGEKLSGWFIHAKNDAPRATILHFHGNAENISTHFMYFSWLTEEGFDLIVFDYRGYGASTGEPSRNGLLLDSTAALSWTRNNSRTKDLFIVAQSLGGAVVIPAFVKDPVNGVKAIVLDSTFASYRSITRQKLSSIWLTWPLQWPLSFLVSDELSPIDFIQKVHVPLLFLHSLKDPVVPFESGCALYLAAPQPKELWEVKWGGHTSAFVNKDDLYRKQLVKYFTNFLTK